MASLSNLFQGGFDATTVEPDQGRDFAPLPAGAYEAEITGSEVKDASTGNGCYLKLELSDHRPDPPGPQGVVEHHAAQCERPGREHRPGAAVGPVPRGRHPEADDSDQLFQKLVRVRLKVKPASGNYAAGNEVTAYEAMGSTPPVPTSSAARPAANSPAAAPAAAPAAGAVPPWQRRG
jgi:hypothetical protein